MVCGHVGVQIGLAVLAVGTQGKSSGNEDLLSFLEVVDDAAPVTADLVVGRTLLLSGGFTCGYTECDEFASVLSCLDFRIGDEIADKIDFL